MLVNLQCTENSLSYAGNIDDYVIKDLVIEIDKWLVAKKESAGIKRKIITSCLEILQNICTHSKNKNGFVVISSGYRSYEAGIGSVVTQTESKNISWEIEKIKFYTKAEIYQKTSNKILNMENGLGLLNVVTLTNKNLNIDFKSFNNDDLFMVLNFTVDKTTS